jgi:NAD(P)-dependent dehydrogenase (short-subunit alcohol dehydrogenase family)
MLHNMTEEEWDTVLNVHLKGTFAVSRHAAGPMRNQKSGRIINVASAAFQGSTGQANYSAAKGGIISLTRTSALELGRYGITCNCIIPMAATRLTVDEVVRAKFKRQLEEGAITKTRYEEMVNMPGPEFIAPLAVYLASDLAAKINGVLFRSAGGTVGVYSEPVINRIIHRNVSKDGPWPVDDLADLVPKILLAGYVNPAPPQPDEKAK